MLNHGGDTFGFEETYGIRPLDFSVNTNPFGTSPKAAEAIHRAVERADEYPDPLCRALRRAIADHEGVSADWVHCGAGAAELIWKIVLALRPSRALVTAPTFSEYEQALGELGCGVEHHFLREEESFRLGEDILDRITPETDMVFLCNPNNPTGICLDGGLPGKVLERCEKNGAVLVADECFLSFLPNGENLSLKPRLGSSQSLVILKAFTKIYGLAGLRLGYCLCSNGDITDKLRRVWQSWPVSILAAEAGIAALGDREYVEKTAAFIGTERERVRRAMEKLGFRVYPGRANFLLLRTDIPNFDTELARMGILIRNCGNYVGLGEGYYRAAILTPEKNDRLLTAMDRIRRNAQ